MKAGDRKELDNMISMRLTEGLARLTTSLAKRVFESRGMAYPHPAEASAVIGIDPVLSEKYELVIKEHHLKQEEKFAAMEEGANRGPAPTGR